MVSDRKALNHVHDHDQRLHTLQINLFEYRNQNHEHSSFNRSSGISSSENLPTDESL